MREECFTAEAMIPSPRPPFSVRAMVILVFAFVAWLPLIAVGYMIITLLG